MFLDVCIGISIILIAIGIFVATINVSFAYKNSKNIRADHVDQRSKTPDATEVVRTSLNEQLRELSVQKFGKNLIAPDGMSMGGNPNAAKIVAKNLSLNSTPKVGETWPNWRQNDVLKQDVVEQDGKEKKTHGTRTRSKG